MRVMSSYRAKPDSRQLTKGLLICGITLAPLFWAVVIVQSFTRAGGKRPPRDASRGRPRLTAAFCRAFSRSYHAAKLWWTRRWSAFAFRRYSRVGGGGSPAVRGGLRGFPPTLRHPIATGLVS